MGNEHDVMALIKLALEHDDQISAQIVTENDMEIYIDDFVFRVHVEGDIV